MTTLEVFSDGGAIWSDFHQRWEGFCGYVISIGPKNIDKRTFYIGKHTNNEAEYIGLINALDAVEQIPGWNKFDKIVFHLDSLLVINQMKGIYLVKAKELELLHAIAKGRYTKIAEWTKTEFQHIPGNINPAHPDHWIKTIRRAIGK